MRGGEKICKVVKMTQNRSIAFHGQDWYMEHVIRTDMLITEKLVSVNADTFIQQRKTEPI